MTVEAVDGTGAFKFVRNSSHDIRYVSQCALQKPLSYARLHAGLRGSLKPQTKRN